MVSMNQGLGGRTVYGGGSYAPTRGRVSAAGANGYLQREMRKNRAGGNVGLYGGVSRMGNDGQSDTRSGMASAMLERRRGGTPVGQPLNMGGGRQNQANPLPGQGGGSNQNPNKGPGYTALDGRGGNVTPQQPIPYVQVNANGQLELPTNAAFNSQIYDYAAQLNQQLLEAKGVFDGAVLENSRNVAAVNEQGTLEQRSIRNGASAGGVGFSSAYANTASDAANRQARALDDLSMILSQQTRQYDSAVAGAQVAMNDQIKQAVNAYTEELAQNAGNLGFGQGTQPTSPGQNSSAYGPNGPRNGGGKGKGGKGKGGKGKGGKGPHANPLSQSTGKGGKGRGPRQNAANLLIQRKVKANG